MQKESLITVNEFCSIHQIDFSFMYALNDFGFIEIIKTDNNEFISLSQLPELEKTIRLHDEFGINLEGIETINHLIDKINQLQNELNNLQNKLRLYEDTD